MKQLLSEIRKCTICAEHLPLGPRPVIEAHENAQVVIIGQAPGTKVHASGVPWDDASGVELRRWMDLSEDAFYDNKKIAIVPMGFCYPGKGKSGDLPPRPECASTWHESVMNKMPNVKLTMLIGTYAQRYYLRGNAKRNLTETVRDFRSYGPRFFPLPHPSPRNRFWRSKNPWFEDIVIPALRSSLAGLV